MTFISSPRRAAIETVGAHLCFLLPYRPDFNPIQLAFTKLKAFLRAARPRAFDQVCTLIATALEHFISPACYKCVQHCRYRIATGSSRYRAAAEFCQLTGTTEPSDKPVRVSLRLTGRLHCARVCQ